VQKALRVIKEKEIIALSQYSVTECIEKLMAKTIKMLCAKLQKGGCSLQTEIKANQVHLLFE
jgi:hypothetical protein